MLQSILPDKTLGHLMELAFNRRNEQSWLYFRSEKLHSNYPVDDFLDLNIQEYKPGDFFSLKVLPGLQTFRLIEDIGLRIRMEKNFSNQGFFSKKDEVSLIKNKKAIQSLQDIVEISDKQRDNLTKFLQNYAEQFSEKKLIGQENFDKPKFFCLDLEAKLTSQEVISKKGKVNLGDDGPITGYYSHKVLYLNYLNKIDLKEIIQKKVVSDGKNKTYYTTWTIAHGNRPKYLWHIVYDIPKNEPKLHVDHYNDNLSKINSGNDFSYSEQNIIVETIIAQNNEWQIFKHTTPKKYWVKSLLTGQVEELGKSRYLKVFIDYVKSARLTKKEIAASWNVLSKGGWGKLRKTMKPEDAPLIHRQVRDGLKAIFSDVQVKFERQKGSKSQSYLFKTKQLQKK